MVLNLLRLIKINFLIFLFFSCDEINKKDKNVIIILADDLGYSDLSYFGSEIKTNNIDFLGKNGVVFTNFYSSPLCAPSRAMLLSGNDNHTSGIGIQAYNSDLYGYEGVLSKRVKIIPEILKEYGYKSFLSGKWHIGGDPIDRGFDNTFTLLPGAFTHYDNNKPIEGYPDTAFSENGKKVLWQNGKYSSDVYTDKMIDFINDSNGSSFFAYLSYTSPHWPLQVDKKHSDKYIGFYDNGYEEIRKKRYDKLISKDILPGKTKIDKDFSESWNVLTDDEKRLESKKMEVYAGMIDNLDFNIGKLLDFLRHKKILDNTIIIFMSDNGAAAEDFFYNKTYGPYIQSKFTYDNNLIGSPESFASIGKEWAQVITYPFKLYKGFSTSGGMLAPLIIYGLDDIKPQISKEFTSIMDIAPSIYQILGIESMNKRDLKSSFTLDGESIIPYLYNKQNKIHDKNYVFSFEHSGNAVLIKDNWKLVNKITPFDEKNFELYKISDISESENLKSEFIDVYNKLLIEWNDYKRSKKIIFPTPYRDDLN